MTLLPMMENTSITAATDAAAAITAMDRSSTAESTAMTIPQMTNSIPPNLSLTLKPYVLVCHAPACAQSKDRIRFAFGQEISHCGNGKSHTYENALH